MTRRNVLAITGFFGLLTAVIGVITAWYQYKVVAEDTAVIETRPASPQPQDDPRLGDNRVSDNPGPSTIIHSDLRNQNDSYLNVDIAPSYEASPPATQTGREGQNLESETPKSKAIPLFTVSNAQKSDRSEISESATPSVFRMKKDIPTDMFSKGAMYTLKSILSDSVMLVNSTGFPLTLNVGQRRTLHENGCKIDLLRTSREGLGNAPPSPEDSLRDWAEFRAWC